MAIAATASAATVASTTARSRAVRLLRSRTTAELASINSRSSRANASPWSIDAKVNGNSIFTQDVTIADVNGDWTSPSFTLADIGNPAVGAGSDNYIELSGAATAGDSRWLSLDYVQLDNNVAVPEPSIGLLVFFGGLALLPVIRRRRK